MHPSLTQTILLIVGVGCILAAAMISRRHRRKPSEHHPNARSIWWRGEPGPVNPRVGAGWLAFVLLNALYAITQPILAAGLFVRAYVLRALFLRKDR
jgi:hypothetical protein